MIWFWGIIILGASVVSATAQELKVRSGEHGQFTRVVVYTPRPGAWKFGRVADGYELRLPADDIKYDLSTAFDLIPRSRLKALKDLENGRLRFEVDCQCHAKVFIASGGQIVVDIVTGTGGADQANFEEFLDAPTRKFTSSVGGSTSARLGLPLFPSYSDQSVELDVAGADTASDVITSEQQSEKRGDNAKDWIKQSPQSRVKQTELALIEQIGRAAAQGLVDANLSTLEAELERANDPIAEQKPERPEMVEAEVPIPVTPTLDANEHIAIQTSIDRESISRKSEVRATQEGFDCLPDREYEISTWGEYSDKGVDLAKFNSAILGEFDRPNSEALNAYIRHQIFLTFGAEAMSLAQEFSQAVHRVDVIQQMADIMDWHKSRNYREFAPQMGCDGKTALWAALAQPEFRPGQEINRQAIISSFSDLPLHLRRHLGPELAQKFLEFGDHATAVSLRNLLDRAGGEHGPGFELLEARIDIQEGEHDGAETTLNELVNDDSDLSPLAALEFVESRLAQGEAVPERIIEIISTYAYEQRDLPLGVELKMAEIRALAVGSDFQRALSETAEASSSGLLSGQQLEDLQQDILANLVSKGSDTQFLRYVVGLPALLQSPDENLKPALATRLVQLGFPAQARTVLETENGVPDVAQRIIFAKIALAERKPDVALGYLAGLETEEVEALQAQAFVMAEEFVAAAELYQELGEQEKKVQAELRAGAWQELAQTGPPALREMGRIITASDSETPTDFAGPLAYNEGMLKESEEMRSALDKFLSELPRP